MQYKFNHLGPLLCGIEEPSSLAFLLFASCLVVGCDEILDWRPFTFHTQRP